MKCSKCAYCIRSYKDSYSIDCIKFGDDTREASYCIYYTTHDDFVKQKIKMLNDFTREKKMLEDKAKL